MLECPRNLTTARTPRHLSVFIAPSTTVVAPAQSSTPLHHTTSYHIPQPEIKLNLNFSAYLQSLLLPYCCIAFFAVMALSWKPGRKKHLREDVHVISEKPSRSDEWVRPLGAVEHLMAVGGYYDTMNTVQAVWLSSKSVITEAHLEVALSNLVVRIPMLKLTLGRRTVKLWFRRSSNFSIDCSITTKDPMEVYQQLLATKYDMLNGPLWKARLVKLPVSSDSDRIYNYVLIFSVQHAITDGTTNMIICKETVAILNSLLGGGEAPRVIYPIIPPLMDTIRHNATLYFFIKYFFSKMSSTMFTDFSRISTFGGALPRPLPTTRETKILHTELTPDLTKKLISSCKAEKVTVHSCIVAAMNFALFRVAQNRANFKLESSKIHLTNCINMRKYYPAEHQYAAGCHISLEEQVSKITSNDFNEFWKQARYLHQTLRKHLDNNLHVKVTPLFYFIPMIYPVNDFLTDKKKYHKTDSHYVTTNMGDLKNLLPEGKPNDPIEITNLLRSVSCEYAGNPCMLTFHTFKGRFMISIDYYTTKMTDEVAKDIFSLLVTYIKNIAEVGTINAQII